MRFKQFLSVFIAVSLLFVGTCAISSAEDNEEISSATEVLKVPENIKGLLGALGLMDETEMDSTGYVGRGYAAEVLLRFEKIYEYGTATGDIYIDVPADSTYAYAIETASKCGYFFGTGDGKFKPDESITPMQMATVLLRFAGYNDNIINSGAEKSKLMKNVGGTEYLTYQGLAYMLYNFLDINIVTLSDSFSATDPSYTKSRTETILDNCFEIQKFKGIVSETDITGLWAGSDLADGRVIISSKNENIIFGVGETDIGLMLGRSVEAYYKYDKDEDLSVILYYDPLDGKNKITEIDLFDIDYGQSDESQIVYYPEENTEYQLKYSKKTAIIYNGTYYADTVSVIAKINGKEGKMTAVDNDSDGLTDLINVEAYDTYVVNSVVLSSKTVFSKNTNQSLSLKEEDYDSISLTYVNGDKAFIEDFSEGVVVSVAKNSDNSDKKVIKVLVSDETVNGTVTEIHSNERGKDIIQLDNMNEYLMLKSALMPNLGQGVTVFLNAFGNVAWVDYENVGEFAYGIITKASIDERKEKVKIKMITAKNTIEVFDIEEKLTVDKDVYKSMEKLYTKINRQDNVSVGNYKLPAGVYPVRYKLKADGSLSELDTTSVGAQENDNTLELLNSGNHMLQYDYVMGGVFAVRESTPVFRVMAKADDDDIVEITYLDDTRYTRMSNVKSMMSTGESYNYAAYKVDKDSVFADFIILCSGWGQGYADKLFVIEKISTIYDSSTAQTLTSIHGVENGVEKVLTVSDMYEERFRQIGLVCGDVIRYRLDGYDHVIQIENNSAAVKHNVDSINLNNISSGQGNLEQFRKYASSTQMIYGYVVERRDNFITVSAFSPGSTVDGKRSQSDMEKDTILVKIPATAPIAVFDPTKGKKVFVATYDEILDYKHSGKNCSLVAMHFRTARLLELVVLNDYSLYE